MVGMAHVALNIGLCSAMVRKAPGTPMAVRVRITDVQRNPHLDQTYRFTRGIDPHQVIGIDMERGVYRVEVSALKFNCGRSEYLSLASEHDRAVDLPLRNGPAQPTYPLLLMGTLPQSFQNAEPTYQLFDKSAVACDRPIAEPLAADITAERDEDAYYAWIRPNAAVAAKGMDSATLALRLKTPQGDYHYIRIPWKFPAPWDGWPHTLQFNIKEEELLQIQGDKTDTLLCPRFFKTSVY